MKRLKSYTSIWSVEKVFYAFGDWNLPFSLTGSQITWFVISFLMVVIFRDLLPLNLIENKLLVYVVLPIAFTWFMCQKTFDGKKPFNFLLSFIGYLMRTKATYGRKPIRYKRMKINKTVTAVRSEVYVPD
ncbi:conjugal transfer protein [Robinsoniella peoriensis]|uniref:TcpE family protein n=1 Tax=Robinsoniella peoriensis TaxID=180332 RepID=A0A4U8Q340_9FIRM|nr:conjugal transfer protein [Robinsoniella peoriensis]TLC99169.1 TcpE family protein [Robinsoniella peoriensis]